MNSEKVVIRRALLGVADKSGLAEFAKMLARHGVEILSTGGTMAALEAAGVKVRSVESFTGSPEMLDGRGKTLHPKIHGGILARRGGGSHLPAMLHAGSEQALRYGENPHQTGALYGRFLDIAHQLHGKELSFNNVVDISSAMNLMLEFQDEQRAVVAILKHNTPCGVGAADTLKGAWDKAFATDPDSPFGGIIIANRAWDMEFARAVDELFTEVLIGLSYPDEVIAFLRKKKNRRVMTVNTPAIDRRGLDNQKVLGGILVQTPGL